MRTAVHTREIAGLPAIAPRAAAGRAVVRPTAAASATPAVASLADTRAFGSSVRRARGLQSRASRKTTTRALAAASPPWKTKDARLVLEDGSVWHGVSFGAKGTEIGEVVFNTSLTGYQEIMTDPSYKGQFVTFTLPHIGNVGINLGAASCYALPGLRALKLMEVGCRLLLCASLSELSVCCDYVHSTARCWRWPEQAGARVAGP